MGANEWVVEYYRTSKEKNPVREFLKNLDHKTSARFDYSIEQ